MSYEKQSSNATLFPTLMQNCSTLRGDALHRLSIRSNFEARLDHASLVRCRSIAAKIIYALIRTDNGPIEEFNLARTSSVSPILKKVWRNVNIYLCLALLMFGVLALPLHATTVADVTNFPEVVS